MRFANPAAVAAASGGERAAGMVAAPLEGAVAAVPFAAAAGGVAGVVALPAEVAEEAATIAEVVGAVVTKVAVTGVVKRRTERTLVCSAVRPATVVTFARKRYAGW